MNLPPFVIFPELRTESLLLRETKPEDIPAMLEILTYDGEFVKTLNEGIQVMERIHQNYLTGDCINWLYRILQRI
jgi:[ribosomal protein S5]-alanine N-acetyltransferase